MKVLIVEDDFISRLLLQNLLIPYGEVHIAVDGKEALDAVGQAFKENKPYDLICLDIMMPEMDGQIALKQIREMEKEKGIQGPQETKVLMTTALDDPKNVFEAYYKGGASSYLVKPVDKAKLERELQALGLIG